MPAITVSDKIRLRTLGQQLRLIQEHLEAMQRDSHGLEYDPWKREVDHIWKQTFKIISQMSVTLQQTSLEKIRELWMSYVRHYATSNQHS